MARIEGQSSLQRLSRDIVGVIQEHWRREFDLDALIMVEQSVDTIAVLAKSWNTGAIAVTVERVNNQSEVAE